MLSHAPVTIARKGLQMHKIDPAVLKQICVEKRVIRGFTVLIQRAKANNEILEIGKYVHKIAEAVATLQKLTNCEQYIIDEVLPVKVKHEYTQAAEVQMTTNGQLGFNFRATGHISEVYKTQDGTEYFVLAIV